METNKRKQRLLYLLFFVVGIFLGWLFFGGSSNEAAEGHSHAEAESTVWTCSMHPQIRQDKKALCPLCAMDLIPLKAGGSANLDPDAIALSKEAIALANVQTTPISRSNPEKEMRLYGTIQADERLVRAEVSHVSGRIEKLAVNFTGETIRKGQVVATLYSPDLLNAQQELLEAAKMQPAQPVLLEAAREKLRLWKLTNQQIETIEKSGKASALIDIVAHTEGIVTGKKVEQGDYVSQGSILFEVTDLSSVWALFDAYEADLPYLKLGDRVEYTLQALPGKRFSGKISFIDPLLNKTTRTAKVRVETANANMQLKPEMYAQATIQASLKQHADAIVIPKSAVLWTGKRSIVYLKIEDGEAPAFKLQEVELGPSLGDAYVITAGLKEGDEIVTSGTFAIDASAQLEGKRSMMNMGEPEPDIPATAVEATLTVEGACGMCTTRIEKVSKEVKGVFSAKYDLETMKLLVKYDAKKTNSTTIAKALAAVGHDSENIKADDAVYNALPGCCKYRGKSAMNVNTPSPAPTTAVEATLTVGGACGMCTTRIEKVSKEVKGVSSAKYDLKTKKLKVTYDAKQTNPQAIAKALAAVGHDGDNIKADDAVYNALPGCCKYRGKE